ncbi:hypothetical protein PK35_12550 [Tamlana nanhaiensis]|uniref:STAS/SEC14 domain-containing protein n=1 Tax=Neotamlana nanhaiensis TaxID=1382798 RepID=A0A0D7VYL3_9FLAO|nr:hypothetical protein [Tamlana nanhaiensis]KJD31970.1 hypothetical protein PK35_12550 [Tamlana nanhaiensis]
MKKTFKLSFGVIKILYPNLAEVIVNEGIIMNEIMVDEYHDFLLTNLETPFNLIINKQNSYSYTYGAQKSIADLKEINAMAVVVATSGSLLSTETLMGVNEHKKWNLKIFRTREEALEWLLNLN